MNRPFRLSTILQDLESLVAVGIVPKTVGSFAELHDFIDANCLGGLCDDETFDGLIEEFGGREQGSMPQGMLDRINKYHNAVDLLIKSGFFKD